MGSRWGSNRLEGEREWREEKGKIKERKERMEMREERRVDPIRAENMG